MTFDPREDISHEITVGNTYEDSRTDETLTLLFKDDQSVLLRDEDGYTRLETTPMFEKHVGGERYSLVGETEVSGEFVAPDRHDTVAFEDVDRVGAKGASELRKAGYSTKGDIRRASDEELIEVDYIGETTVENIREYIEE